MELIVIDETKLKIMLTAPDMRHYDLHAERMTAANAATRNAFRHIFEDARAQIGFDTTGERLLVQLYSSRGGGCEIFVTKLCEEDDTAVELSDVQDVTDPFDFDQDVRDLYAEDALMARIAKEEAMPIPPASAIGSLPPEDIHCNEEPETCAYRFSEAEDLFALCRRLAFSAYVGESSVYISENHGSSAWYLFLTPARGNRLPPFVREYAPEVPDADALRLYLSEHGQVVCPSGATAIMGNI